MWEVLEELGEGPKADVPCLKSCGTVWKLIGIPEELGLGAGY